MNVTRQRSPWKRPFPCATLLAVLLAGPLAADEAATSAKPIPRTRPEMKQALERLKHRTPRLPLPAGDDNARSAPGSRPAVNNGRARALYLPASWQTRSFDPDPAMSLDYVFKTRLFWIVSRCNNCHYCLGHQEHKLASSGQSDDQIAELDTDWSACPAHEQAAFALARKMTLEPYAVSDADIDPLRFFYNPRQIVEIVYTIASYNATNRWTDSLGLPQDSRMRDHEIHLDTPTADKFRTAECVMVPRPLPARPSVESRAQIVHQFELARERTPRVPLPSAADVRQVLGQELGDWPVMAWMRPLSLFPTTAANQVRVFRAIVAEGELPERLKAQLCWIAARENRAWYALAATERWLHRLGDGTDVLDAFPETARQLPPADRAACQFATKLTSQPQSIADQDIADLRANYSDAAVAQIVQVVCVANFFDRFTETLRLPLD